MNAHVAKFKAGFLANLENVRAEFSNLGNAELVKIVEDSNAESHAQEYSTRVSAEACRVAATVVLEARGVL